MEELGSKPTSTRCEAEQESGYNPLFVFLPAGLLGLLMVALALLFRGDLVSKNSS